LEKNDQYIYIYMKKHQHDVSKTSHSQHNIEIGRQMSDKMTTIATTTSYFIILESTVAQ